jgi:hypothetical protein
MLLEEEASSFEKCSRHINIPYCPYYFANVDSKVLNPNFYYMEYYRQNALSTREDIDIIY